MKNAFTLAAVVLITALLLPLASTAQNAQPAQNKPYHEGPVWDIAFIRVKAGMDDRYLRYLADGWKQEQEALKKAGYVIDYKVIQTEAHGSNDWDLMLMTEFKNLATMEANSDKMEAIALGTVGGQQQMEQGYQQRVPIREVVGGRLGREIILTPKTGGQ